jgi:hypothetical protein
MLLVWYLKLQFIPHEIAVPIVFEQYTRVCSKACTAKQAYMYNTYHHRRPSKFEGVLLCDLWVIPGGWVIALHVSANPQCQNLSSNYPNTSEPQCGSDPCTVVLALAHHPMKPGKFEGVSLCDFWVIAGGWVITLHVFACPYHQNLLANYSNTPAAWGVLHMYAVVLTFPVCLVCLKHPPAQ